MTWNPSPEMALARLFARKHRKDIVIIVSVDESGEVRTHSYGKTKALCEGPARRIGDDVHRFVTGGGAA